MHRMIMMMNHLKIKKEDATTHTLKPPLFILITTSRITALPSSPLSYFYALHPIRFISVFALERSYYSFYYTPS